MRWLAFLTFVVGLGLGYLLGAAEDAGRRTHGERRELSDLSVVQREEGAPAEERIVPGAVPEENDDVRAIARTGAAVGTLEVDWSDCEPCDCELSGAGVTTDWTDHGLHPDEDEGETTLVRRTLWMGEYQLSIEVLDVWHRIPVRIDAGRTTRLEMRDLVTRLSQPPPGFGRLVVEVFDIQGEVIKGAVPNLIGSDPTASDGRAEFSMDSDGGARATCIARAGRYRIAFGTHRSSVDIVAGKKVHAAVRYSGEAELHVSQNTGGTFCLRRHGQAKSLRDRDIYPTGGTFYFVRPGRFDLLWADPIRAAPLKLRELTLGSGERLVLQSEVPVGVLTLTVRYPYRSGEPNWAAALRISPVFGGDPILLHSLGASFAINPNSGIMTRFVNVNGLPLGNHRVEFRLDGWKPASVEVDLRSGKGKATLSLKRAVD